MMVSKRQFDGERVKLGEVCNLVMGQSPSSSDCNEKGEGLPFFQGNADFGELSPVAKVWCAAPKKCAEPGDILLSVRAPIGAVNLADTKCCIGRGLVAIRPGRSIRPNYLKHLLLAKRSYLEAQGTGSTFRAIGKKVLSAFDIPVYTAEDQRAIESRLERVQDCIALCKQQMMLLDILVKSRFVEMFGDPIENDKCFEKARLGDVYRVKSSKRIYAKEQTKEGVPFYRLADVGSLIDGICPSSELFISNDKFERLRADGHVPGPEDILVTARGTLGRCYVMSEDDRFYFQDGMITWLAKTNQSPLSVWLVALFANNHFIDQLNNSCSGTTVKYLSLADLSDIRTPIPPLSLQQQFADFVAKVDKPRFVAQRQIEKLQMLYDSLAQEYFG